MNLRTTWVLASAEMRSCRRLARTWVFITITVLVCVFWYIGSLDTTTSPWPPIGWSHDQLNPRYTVASMMNIFVAIFSFGIIFLTFDIRARDVQNHIRDVIDTLPATNVEIIVGRVFGILLLLLIPAALFLALVACYEIASQLFNSPYRMGIQPMSIVAHIGWNILPNLVFYGALVAFLSTLVRIRLLVATVALGVLFGSLWVTNQIPVLFQESLSPYIGSALFPSDLAPVFATPTIVGSRIAMLLVSIALLLFAASLLPRTEPRRNMNTAMGISASVLGTIMTLGLVFSVQGNESRKEYWVTAHEQQSPSSFPDVQHVSGNVVLQPGHNISLNVELTVLSPPANTTDSVVFSLNPGYKIQKLFVDDEEISDFKFEAGLLQVSSRLLPEESHKIRVQAHGKLNDRFAYLDQARNFQKLTHSSVSRLGMRNSIFHSEFVALMPGSIWYPISGSVIGRHQPELRQRDLFTSDLAISVPKKWHVAIVGKRKVVENGKLNTFQFTNEAPVPELALLAANFDQRTITIEGIEFELLFSKNHLRNLDILGPIAENIREFVAERIKNARALNLEYPYGAFYIVEVPSNLRIYGGGWRMDTVLQPPGMLLVRETTFPTAQFQTVVDSALDQELDSEGGQQEQIFNRLLEYFGNDQHGGSPFLGFDRNFVAHQVTATQKGATVLQYLIEQLSNLLITQREGCSIISLAEYGTGPAFLMSNQTPEYHAGTLATKRRMDIAFLPSTWDVMAKTALFDLEFNGRPVVSHRVLLSKGHALAKSMISRFGREKIGAFLVQLLRDHRAHSFTLEELVEIADSLDLDLHEWVIPWLESSVMPGYLVGTPSISKLATPEFGESEVQTTFDLHNAESMPGMVRIVWSESDYPLYQWGHGSFIYSDPIFLAGSQTKRLAIQSAKPLTGVWIDPFISHNRTPIEVLLPEYVETEIQQSPALPFMTDSEWQDIETEAVVVDDLDSGFSIVYFGESVEDFSFSQQVLRLSTEEREYDQGLPVGLARQLDEWQRVSHPTSYGHYRRTHARIASGSSSSAARYEASIPRAGLWRLDYFVTDAAFLDISYGYSTNLFGFAVRDRHTNRKANPNEPEEHYRLEIKDEENEWKQEFDIANARVGWNEVGEFELSSTEVEVFLSDWAGHKDIMVHADAIRWIPVKTD